MKNAIVFFMCLYLINSANAQNVFFEDFEGYYGTNSPCYVAGGACGPNSIDGFSCLDQWGASHGTPDHFYNNSGNSSGNMISDYENNIQIGEGMLSRPIPELEKGKTYKICFNYTTSFYDPGAQGIELNVFLTNTNSPLSHTPLDPNACLDVIPNNIPHQTIISDTESSLDGEWSSKEQVFTFTGNNVPHLWIYSRSFVQASFKIDNIGISEISDCLSDIIVNSNVSLDIAAGVYQAENIIQYETSNATAYIESDPDGAVVFRAGESITLNPNFFASPNLSGHFYAHIAPCESYPCTGLFVESRLMDSSSNAMNDEVEQLNSSYISGNNGKRNLSNSDMKIIPNPNNGSFRVTMNDLNPDEKYNLSITNLVGQSILSKEYSSIENINEAFDFENKLTPGTYLVSLRGTSDIYHQRVVIQ